MHFKHCICRWTKLIHAFSLRFWKFSPRVNCLWCKNSTSHVTRHELHVYTLTRAEIYSNKIHVGCILEFRDSWEVPSCFVCSLWQRGADDNRPPKIGVFEDCLLCASNVWLIIAVIVNMVKIAWSKKFVPERKTSGHWTCEWLTEASCSGFSLNQQTPD